jgi:hypothetical protein
MTEPGRVPGEGRSEESDEAMRRIPDAGNVFNPFP